MMNVITFYIIQNHTFGSADFLAIGNVSKVVSSNMKSLILFDIENRPYNLHFLSDYILRKLLASDNMFKAG